MGPNYGKKWYYIMFYVAWLQSCAPTYFNGGHLGFMLIKKNTPGEFDVIIRNLFLGILMYEKMQ